ncbi:MAG: DNA-directed RNA polymerase subunit omega [Puniceicoccales bacterium]|jgi:DNA-directed RNA polymerase subunit omega|nr:DNA-directed RNA polymerase subunit omega [Puniceicoccales bacterium]
MKDKYIKRALATIPNVNVLINLVSQRVKQLRNEKNKPLIQSLERLEIEDIVLREIIEGHVSYALSAKPKSEQAHF